MQLVPSSPVDATVSSKPSSTKAHVFPSDHRLAFGLVTLLFFIWGMSNNLTDILVQQFKKSFELSAFQAQLVQTAVFLGYFCMALPAALLMQRRGYRFGIVSGLCLFGVGTFNVLACRGECAILLDACCAFFSWLRISDSGDRR